MSIYPPPPWNLAGRAFQTLHLLDVDRVSALIPTELSIISVFPGKTVGGVYLAAYGTESTLIYNELIVVSAIVHHEGHFGAWISHIYVDNPDSVAGGREIWGLPKELAQFQWQWGKSPQVRVSREGHLLCSLSYRWQLPGWQQPLAGSIFSLRDSQLMRFKGQGTLKLSLVDAELEVPSESDFAWLGLEQARLSLYCDPLRITVAEPVAVKGKG